MEMEERDPELLRLFQIRLPPPQPFPSEDEDFSVFATLWCDRAQNIGSVQNTGQVCCSTVPFEVSLKCLKTATECFERGRRTANEAVSKAGD